MDGPRQLRQRQRGGIMRSMAMLVVAATFLAVGGIGLPVVQAAEQSTKKDDQQWRFTFHNGEWWYWLPANRWVYWRDNRWNDYDPQTFTYRSAASVVPAGRAQSSAAGQTNLNSDIRPFYGHSQSELDWRPLGQDSETGPFYGHALPSEVFGPGRARHGIRPYYGRAISSEGD